MLTRASTLHDAIAIHEAGYAVAARVLDAALRPTRLDRGLRRYANDVLDEARTDPEWAAIVMLAGGAALRRFDPNVSGANDEVEARTSILREMLSRYGVPSSLTPSFKRSYIAQRHDELAAQAKTLVAEHWPLIEAEAERLLDQPSRPRRKRA
jgi:hypothetical protein